MEVHVVGENAGLPAGDPLQGAAVAGRWSFGYDMPDDLGGGFVSGELLLRSDGVLLRRYGGSTYRAGQMTWQFKPWEPVTWWGGETVARQGDDHGRRQMALRATPDCDLGTAHDRAYQDDGQERTLPSRCS